MGSIEFRLAHSVASNAVSGYCYLWPTVSVVTLGPVFLLMAPIDASSAGGGMVWYGPIVGSNTGGRIALRVRPQRF